MRNVSGSRGLFFFLVSYRENRSFLFYLAFLQIQKKPLNSVVESPPEQYVAGDIRIQIKFKSKLGFKIASHTNMQTGI